MLVGLRRADAIDPVDQRFVAAFGVAAAAARRFDREPDLEQGRINALGKLGKERFVAVDLVARAAGAGHDDLFGIGAAVAEKVAFVPSGDAADEAMSERERLFC